MKTCTRCGANFDDTVNFCENCGFQLSDIPYYQNNAMNNSCQGVVYVPVQQMMPQTQSNGAGVAALVLGILGLFLSWITLGIPSLLAIILGGVGIAEAKSDPQCSSGSAVAGLILGLIVFVGEILFIVCFGTFFLFF